jgi:hypothetical protein
MTGSIGRPGIIAHGKSSGSRRGPPSLASIKAAAPRRDTRSAVIAAVAPVAIAAADTIVIVAVATVIAAAAAVVEPTTVMVAAIAPVAVAATAVAPMIVMPAAIAPMPDVAAATVIPVIASMATIFATITTRIRPGIGRSGRGAQRDCHAEHNDESTQLPQHDMSAVVELGVTLSGGSPPTTKSRLLVQSPRQ